LAATFYTLIESAKLQGVDPAKYLLVAVRASESGEILMPWELVAPEPPSADVKTG